MPEFVCPTANDLPVVAIALIEAYPEGGVFLLSGEMGAGKTTLVRAVCDALGASHPSSPTFSLVNEYEGKNGISIIHMDLYRVRSTEEALDFGFDEYLQRKGYLFIEWPEHIRGLTGGDYTAISIAETPEGRHIQF